MSEVKATPSVSQIKLARKLMAFADIESVRLVSGKAVHLAPQAKPLKTQVGGPPAFAVTAKLQSL